MLHMERSCPSGHSAAFLDEAELCAQIRTRAIAYPRGDVRTTRRARRRSDTERWSVARRPG